MALAANANTSLPPSYPKANVLSWAANEIATSASASTSWFERANIALLSVFAPPTNVQTASATLFVAVIEPELTVKSPTVISIFPAVTRISPAVTTRASVPLATPAIVVKPLAATENLDALLTLQLINLPSPVIVAPPLSR